MKASSSIWWLLPFGITIASSLFALYILVFGLSFSSPLCRYSPPGIGPICYQAYQERYQNLVWDTGVEAAFTQLKDEHAENSYVRGACHRLTHVIGRAAIDRYGDLSSAYSNGDTFCGAGYYHGAMEALVAKIGADKILEQANTLCADLRERQEYSFYHYSCVHGLGHGFM